jgi:transposase-like protein
MNTMAFEAWLAMVRSLTMEQRQRVFLALALAEADDSPQEAAAAEPPRVVDVAREIRTRAARRGKAPADRRPALALVPVLAAANSRVAARGCPHCASQNLALWGQASGLPRYRCGVCRRTFNALTGTAMANLRKKELWADQAEALETGESLVAAAQRCGVAVTTAFRWRHRFLAASTHDKPEKLTGIVEADETFILESFKGRRSGLPRPARERGGKAAKRGLSAEQIPVLVARDRSGATTDAILPKLSKAAVTAALGGVVTTANQLCCDGGKAIVGFARKGQIPCHILPAPGGPRPEAPNLHINNVNGYHGRLKEWLRPFHGVATKYLDHYLGWRRTAEALGADIRPEDWLRSAVGIGPYQQITQ